jgi:methionyl-tRNA formyltransferase
MEIDKSGIKLIKRVWRKYFTSKKSQSRSTIIKKGFLNTPKIGVFNVHMGILPKYRGIGVTEWPILEASESAAPLLGVTLHIMDTGVDSGPIIEEKRIMLDSGDEIHDLDQKYLPEMVRLMISGVKKARDGILELTQQKSEDGKQYFMLHDRMKEIASKKIKKYV